MTKKYMIMYNRSQKSYINYMKHNEKKKFFYYKWKGMKMKWKKKLIM